EEQDGSTRVSIGAPSDDSKLQPPHQSFPVLWAAPTAQIRLHVFEIQLDPVTGAPVHYVGYDTTHLALANGLTLPWTPTPKPSPFSETGVSPPVHGPQGYPFRGTTFLASATVSAFIGWLPGSTAADGSFTVPELPGASFRISATADGDEGMSWATLPPVAPGT